MTDIAVCKNCKARTVIHNLSGIFGDKCPKCGGDVIINTVPQGRQMTSRERYAAELLIWCKFVPGSYDKRFAHGIYSIGMNNRQITEKQAANLWRMVYRYRRQIKDETLIVEAKRINGDAS